MTPEEILRLLESEKLSVDSLIAMDWQMLEGEERLLREFISLCAKPNEDLKHWSILQSHIVMARATKHPYATLMENLYSKRSKQYGHHTN